MSRFTISSGPFNVPLVKHVIIAMGDSQTQARWNWEYVKSIMFSKFPHFEITRSYAVAGEYCRKSGMHLENVLIFIECDNVILKEICQECGGEFLD